MCTGQSGTPFFARMNPNISDSKRVGLPHFLHETELTLSQIFGNRPRSLGSPDPREALALHHPT